MTNSLTNHGLSIYEVYVCFRDYRAKSITESLENGHNQHLVELGHYLQT